MECSFIERPHYDKYNDLKVPSEVIMQTAYGWHLSLNKAIVMQESDEYNLISEGNDNDIAWRTIILGYVYTMFNEK